MIAKVTFGNGQEAVLGDNWLWTTTVQPWLARFLNLWYSPGRVRPAYGDPEWLVAHRVAKLLGGKLVMEEKKRPTAPNLVY